MERQTGTLFAPVIGLLFFVLLVARDNANLNFGFVRKGRVSRTKVQRTQVYFQFQETSVDLKLSRKKELAALLPRFLECLFLEIRKCV